MADNIIKLKVDSQEYEGKIKRASQGLQELGRYLREAGKTFADADAKQVEFARELGKMQTVSNTAKGKIGEMSAAFVNLKTTYLQMTDAEKQSPIGQAMSKSLEELKNRTIDAKRELEDLNKELNTMKTTETSSGSGGGGLFSGDKLSGMLQVMGGNLMTKGVTMAAGAVTSMVNEIGDAVKQGVELAKQGEGIRIAFERLNQPGLLNNLREATHGTVTDLELMKAAVKFNDFKLPLDELGTMLAFAQQKAKDTGQSVDYMVESITNGLGRQSKPILDNLGISAKEIEERMKSTGDFTKAVGEIIRDKMKAAGDYIETAADRATKANVDLQNAMTRLGETFQPLSDAGTSLWSDLKIGALDLLNNAVRPLIDALTEAGRIRSQYAEQGGDTRVNRQLDRLRGISTLQYRRNTYNAQLSNYDSKIGSYQQYLADYKKWQSDKTAVGAYDRMQAFQKQTGLSMYSDVKEQLEVFKKMRSEYVMGAKSIIADNPAPSPTSTTTTKTTKGGSGKTGPTYAADSIAAQQALVQQLTKQWNEAGADVRDQYLQPLVEAEAKLKEMQNTMALQKAKAEGKLNGVNLWQGDIDDITGGKRAQFAGTLPDLSKSLQLDNLPQFLSPLQQLNAELEQLRKNLEYAPTTEAYQEGLKAIADKEKEIANFKGIDLSKDADKSAKSFQAAAGAISQVGSALNGIEDPTAKILGIIAQAIASVAAGAGQAVSAKDTTSSGWAWIGAAAAITASMVAMISQIHSATGYAQGGIVDGRGGGFVGGTAYSGDNIGNVRLDSGELVLNRAQQSNLANALQSNPMGRMQLSAVVTGEQIRLVLNNNGRRTGRGEYVTTNFT